MTKPYGYELILDLHGCDSSTFTRESIENFFIELCKKIDMKRQDLYFWDDLDSLPEEKQTSPHTKGTSAVQFIITSNITTHTLDDLKKVFINVFSCKFFDPIIVEIFSIKWFKASYVNQHFIDRL